MGVETGLGSEERLALFDKWMIDNGFIYEDKLLDKLEDSLSILEAIMELEETLDINLPNAHNMVYFKDLLEELK